MKIRIAYLQIKFFLHFFEQLFDVQSVGDDFCIQFGIDEIFSELIGVNSLFKMGNSVIKITIIKINKGVS